MSDQKHAVSAAKARGVSHISLIVGNVDRLRFGDTADFIFLTLVANPR